MMVNSCYLFSESSFWCMSWNSWGDFSHWLLLMKCNNIPPPLPELKNIMKFSNSSNITYNIGHLKYTFGQWYGWCPNSPKFTGIQVFIYNRRDHSWKQPKRITKGWSGHHIRKYLECTVWLKSPCHLMYRIQINNQMIKQEMYHTCYIFLNETIKEDDKVACFLDSSHAND